MNWKTNKYKNWQFTKQGPKSLKIDNGFTAYYAIYHDFNNKVSFDWPERIPKYVISFIDKHMDQLFVRGDNYGK